MSQKKQKVLSIIDENVKRVLSNDKCGGKLYLQVGNITETDTDIDTGNDFK